MKAVISFVLLIFISNTLAQHYTHIFELRGLEDSLHNSHLFYRYGSEFTPCWVKNIYYFNTSTGLDTLFILDSASDPIGEGCRGQFIYDYEFFNIDPAKFIYGGYDYYIDPAPLLVRFDGQINVPVPITEIEISQRTASLVYIAFGGFLLKSTDGGYNFTFNEDSLAFIDNSMISLSRNNESHIYGTENNKLVRSEDEGYSYTIVNDYPDHFWPDEISISDKH